MISKEIGQIGKRIKEIRTDSKMRLIDLAEKANVSKGLISRVENGRTIPSLPVLMNIIKTLGVPLIEFFDGIGSDEDRFDYLYFPSHSFSKEEKEDSVGFHYFNICRHELGECLFDATYLVLDANAKREVVCTDGLEFIFLIEGEIEYYIGKENLTMHAGDALFFNGRLPHTKKNFQHKSAKMLVIYLIQSDKK